MINVNGVVFENFKPEKDVKNWHLKTKNDKMAINVYIVWGINYIFIRLSLIKFILLIPGF